LISSYFGYKSFSHNIVNMDTGRLYEWRSNTVPFMKSFNNIIIWRYHKNFSAFVAIAGLLFVHFSHWIYRLRLYYLKPAPTLDVLNTDLSKQQKSEYVWEYDYYYNYSFWDHFSIYHWGVGIILFVNSWVFSYLFLLPFRGTMNYFGRKSIQNITQKYLKIQTK